jgi:hypothetical protein
MCANDEPSLTGDFLERCGGGVGSGDADRRCRESLKLLKAEAGVCARVFVGTHECT